jgi:hypothetical protein
VAMLAFVNAACLAIPSTFIYLVKNVNLKKMVNLPDGLIPLATPSGWMTADLFLISLKHFVSLITVSQEKPILLILDDHISHISWPVVEYCKELGIILFTLPPHTPHITPPLGRGLFGHLKGELKHAHSGWMTLHPGKRISIYDVTGLTKNPYDRRFTVAV